MNNIGIGIMCFGDEYYHTGAQEKIEAFTRLGLPIYVLTDRPELYASVFITEYNRDVKSYHDKMLLVKLILKRHDIAILIDADLHIHNFDILRELTTYEFQKGITYIDTMGSHLLQKNYIGEFDMSQLEWAYYKAYLNYIYPQHNELETIWEYLLIVNKDGLNDDFFKEYEKLQIAKEFSELTLNKEIIGPGEGMSIAVASKITNTIIQRDLLLYNKLKDNLVNISRKFTKTEFLPDFLK